jgi:uncharacterized membrane protein
LGWISETLVFAITERRFRNGGFLNMPVLPVYGAGAVAVIYLVGPYTYNPFLVFVASIIIASAVEYITHLTLDKLLHVQLWNYSHIKFNLQGRICLQNCLGFGALSLLVLYIFQPPISGFFATTPQSLIMWIAMILITLNIIDLFATIHTLFTMSATNSQNQKESLIDIQKSITPKLKDIGLLHSKTHKNITKLAINKVNRRNLKRLTKAFPYGYVLPKKLRGKPTTNK